MFVRVTAKNVGGVFLRHSVDYYFTFFYFKHSADPNWTDNAETEYSFTNTLAALYSLKIS